jgi:prepilin-type N-terminal cleavage/methylation domain-containing protein
MRVVLRKSSGLVQRSSTPSPTSLVDFPGMEAIIPVLRRTLSVGLSMNRRTPRSVRRRGFSLIEMMVTLAVGLVMASVALPFVVGAVQRYRLDSVAQQTASLIDLARYTAIRLNKLTSLQTATQNGNTILYLDMKGTATLDANDPMVVFPSDMQIANGDSLTPPSTSMGLGTTISFASSITFDYRGVLNYPQGTQPWTYFVAIGYVSQAQYGTRAVTVTPMGQTKTWIAPDGGTWTGM